MIQTLRKIVQRVHSAESLVDALYIIASGGRALVKTDACSVYLADAHQNTLTLRATDGLTTELVNKLRLSFNESLVGLVAEREEPINLTNAAVHPRFKFVSELNEDGYDSFLGVPILHAGNLLGVIVTQNKERRVFSEEDESALVTLSAQLASVLAFAEASGKVSEFNRAGTEEIVYKGVAGSSGVGIGKVVVLSSDHDLASVPQRKAESIPQELNAFDEAIANLKNELIRLSKAFGDLLNNEELALFDVYRRMLDDKAIGGEIVSLIKGGLAAESATARVFSEHVRTFKEMNDEYLSERSADVRDLGLRLLANLSPKQTELSNLPDNCIVIAKNLVAAHLGQVDREKIVALVSIKGSNTSHVAILARAMGIPNVMGCEELPFKDLPGEELIVDGYRGRVILNAKPEIKQYYQKLSEEAQKLTQELQAYKSLRSESKDGYRMPLLANTGLATDAIQASQVGAEGVGLYRTEIPFLLKETFPSEGEQRRIYRQQLAALAPLPVTMRTLDVGGDKSLSYFPIEEDNPFLGWRGIRISLDHPELFLTQVRAMILASEGLNNLKIMLPMISSVEEFERANRYICRAFEELKEDGFQVQMPEVGVMIEVPAAVYISEALAKRASFLSVGSNDLIQYLLAVDRNNERVSSLYQDFHPAVLKALQDIADSARRHRIPVSLCGELANDPAAAVLLQAMGYSALSLNSYSLPRVKAVLRSLNFSDMRSILHDVRDMEHGPSIRAYIEQRLRRLSVDPLLLSSHNS